MVRGFRELIMLSLFGWSLGGKKNMFRTDVKVINISEIKEVFYVVLRVIRVMGRN